jgi:hypothetical protein
MYHIKVDLKTKFGAVDWSQQALSRVPRPALMNKLTAFVFNEVRGMGGIMTR